MAKWIIDDTLSRPAMYRHVKTGQKYVILYEGLEVTSDEGVESIVYQNTKGEVFIQAKSRFFDGRFEEL